MKKASTEAMVQAVRMKQAGRTNSDVAEALGYSKAWVQVLWTRVQKGLEPELAAEALTTPPPAAPVEKRDRWADTRPPEHQPAPAAPTQPPPIDVPPVDTLLQAKRTLTKLQSMAERADAEGNTAAAQKYMRDSVEQSKVIRSLEKAARDDGGDSLVLTKEGLAFARKEVVDLINRYRQWPLTCSACGHEIRMAAAQEPPPGTGEKGPKK